ncbi:response regulator [Variovorax paradoxus]|nr:response regulator [Variovorax paradoxus]MBT2305159.1 response regulator [Variovorax paradoxus]
MSLSIFLVEDNPTIQTNLISALEEMANACIVGMATSEPEAVAWLTGHGDQWDLAVVDLFLADGSGLGVVKKLSFCRSRDQRIVVLTNYATGDSRQRCLEVGADAIFDKSNELEAFFAYCLQCPQRGRGALGEQTCHANGKPGAGSGALSLPCRSNS